MEYLVDDDGNPILDQFSEEGFVDLTLRITDLVDDGRHYRFHLAVCHRNRRVGVDAVVEKGIRPGFDEQVDLVKDNVVRRGVRLRSCGEESDRLITAIAELYGVGDAPRVMVEEELYTAIALHQDPFDMDHDPVKLKIFGRDEEPFVEDDYYESYFNVDLAGGFVFWNEKDPDYREPLLRALTAR